MADLTADRLRHHHGYSLLCRQAADLIEAQAARIAELEAERDTIESAYMLMLDNEEQANHRLRADAAIGKVARRWQNWPSDHLTREIRAAIAAEHQQESDPK